VRISVIVTTYNSPDYLKRVLDCFSGQRRIPDELVVADDGSGPETGECVSAFARNATFPVRHVWHEDKGFRAARIRNEAIKSSTGDYIVFLDGDCLVSRHFVSDHQRLAEKGAFFQGKRVLIGRGFSETITVRETNNPRAILRHVFAGEVSNSHHIIRMPFFPPSRKVSHRGIKTCNMGVFRDDIYAVNGFDERFVGWGREDSEFAARLFRLGLVRKDHPFMGICYHLWHPENTRDGLERNDFMLEEAITGGALRCSDGLEKTGDAR